MSHSILPSLASIQRGLAQVLALVTALCDYSLGHAGSGNEILLRVALQLNASALALDKLLRAASFSTFVFEGVLRTLAPADAQLAARLREAVPDLVRVYRREDREELRIYVAGQMMAQMNMLVGVGFRLLEIRRRRDAGQSEADIEGALAGWGVGKVF